jgi:hypothetical protein
MALTGSSQGQGGATLPGQTSEAATPVPASHFGTADSYFDQARKLGFPAAGQTTPYVLRAEFTTRASSGAVTTGTYTDTWVNDKKWRREAVLGESRFIRSRNGKKWYRIDDGPDATLLQFVLTAMEPLPESAGKHPDKWTVQPEMLDGNSSVMVWRGKKNADGTPDPRDFEGYWFDPSGQLIRSSLNGLELKREKFADFNGVHVARQLQVMLTGKVGMRIDVTQLQPAQNIDAKIFTMKGNDWLRQYTSEVR